MTFMVVLIVDDPDDCPAILDGWQAAGVSGVTILDSSGLGRLRRAGLLDDTSIMPSIRDLLGQREVHHRTLISVVEDQQTVDRMVAIVRERIGDLDEPHTGFLFVVPVVEVYGFGRQRADHTLD
jgi:nitrogen regulatory protein PII